MKYQYDEDYVIALEGDVFLHFDDYEEEEAFARHLEYERRQPVCLYSRQL